MQITDFERSSTLRVVKHQKMPDYFFDNMVDVDYLWMNVDWSLCTSTRNGINHLYRNYAYNQDSRFPPILGDMMDWLRCDDISMFIGQCEGSNDTLGWHWDSYHVWAFNVDGVTEWQWFDNISGQVETQVLEPGYIITMPYGITHRVQMVSDSRTSISLITRYGGTFINPPKEDNGRGWEPPSRSGK